jgi:hypothetical protein
LLPVLASSAFGGQHCGPDPLWVKLDPGAMSALRKTPISSWTHSTSGLLDNRSSTALREKNFDGPMWWLALAASMSRITLSSRCCLPLPVGAIPTA